jgi:type I restriction enzyme S subunit
MKTWQGSLGVSLYDGIVSPAYIVCELREDVNPWFIHYLLRSQPYISEYNRISYGVRLGQWDMRYDEFKHILVFLPPKPEQDGIVRFLSIKLRQLDAVIEAYRKLFGAAISISQRKASLLNEYRSCLVADVVTGKMDVRPFTDNLGKDSLEDLEPLDQIQYTVDDEEELSSTYKESQE